MPDSATQDVSTEACGATSIERRDVHFDLAGMDVRNWHPEGMHVAHFFNALSLTFPDGERFFIETVRRYRDQITDPQLQAEVRGFIGQEAMHGREHEAWNQLLTDAGLPTAKIQRWLNRNIDLGRKLLSHRAQLATTMALEHYTAEMADLMLGKPELLAGADPRAAALWRWHAIEETEHKAVAFDVYQAVHGDTRSAWWTRVRTMWMVTIEFWLEVFVYHVTLVRADGGGADWRGWWRAFRYLWIYPGTLRMIPGAVWRYCRRGFHPWEKDNRAYVDAWKADPQSLPKASLAG